MKKLSAIILVLLLTFCIFAESRNALLIANGTYKHVSDLPNPVKEVRDLKKALEKLGFNVTVLENGTREQMMDSLYQFQKKLEKAGGIGFFLYSGHGVQVNGKNFLIPIEADIPDERRVSTRAVDADEVMASMQADTNIVILDACRTNPLPAVSFRSATNGLALTEYKPKNSIIVYSAQPNHVAWDGVFTPILTKKIVEQKEFGSILKEVRKEVLAKTNGEQSPGEYNELITDVYLAGYSTASTNTQSNNNISTTINDRNVAVGYYIFESMTEDNETLTAVEIRQLLGDDTDIGSLVLKNDGTGRMTLIGDQNVLSWDNKKITIDGASASYSLNNNKLIISEDNSTIVFVKKQNIFDYAKLLSDIESSVLSYHMSVLESQYGIGMYFVNLFIDEENINNVNMNDFAKFIYEEENLGIGNSKDGVMLFLEGNSGTLIVYTNGSKIKNIFNDEIIYKMKYAFIEGLDIDETSWFYAYDYYLSEVESTLALSGITEIVTSNSMFNSNIDIYRAGTYALTFTQDAGEVLTAENIVNMNMTGNFLTLKDDGTGTMSMFENIGNVTWDNDKLSVDGDAVSYIYNDGKITISEDGSLIIYEYVGENILDFARTLTIPEIVMLYLKAAVLQQRYKIGIYVTTIPDKSILNAEGYNIWNLSEIVFDAWKLGIGEEKEGILLFIDVGKREYDICAHGTMGNTIFTDDAKKMLSKSFSDEFTNDNWYAGFNDYLEEIQRVLISAEYSVSIDKDSFVFVEGGTFDMGSSANNDNEKPVHKVTVSSFYMCDHEVTQAEYKAVMGKASGYFSGNNRPVESITWYDAIEYCNKLSIRQGLTPCYSLDGKTDTKTWGTKDSSWNNVACNWSANGYRLPTEAEWEYAARGGNKSKDYVYSGSNNIGLVAWFNYNSNNKTHDVKTKIPNELGLYDMSGNVWEWCWNRFQQYNSYSQINPVGSSKGSVRVGRGGSWSGGLSDWDASYCRVSTRLGFSPDFKEGYIGFRVVRSAY